MMSWWRREMEQLTLVEVHRLEVLESVIEAGMQTFVHVGNALLEIRDGRLYRTSHGTFEEYCQEKWQMGRNYANRMIAAAEVVTNLVPVGTIPAGERQARPLTTLPPDAQREVWQEAVESAPNGKVTAAHVQATVNRYRSAVNVEDSWGHVETVQELPAWAKEEVAKPAVAPGMAVHFSSETPEHYTPAEIIEAAIACMGGIDLDPCSNSHEAPNVPAARHYTAADDGLAQRWFGCVYMNPPYGREIEEWVDKLVSEYEHGGVSEAIALVPSRTDTQWWLKLREYHVCLVEGRLKFLGSGKGDPAPFPSAVFYLGGNTDRFVAAFEPIGDIWHRTRHGYCLGE